MRAYFTPRNLGIGIAAGALIALGVNLPIGAAAQTFSLWLATQGLVGAGAFLIIFSIWGLLLPKGPIVAFAGYTYGLHYGLALSYVGATVAIMLGFLIARHWGRHRAQRWMSSRPWFTACDQAISTQGGKIVTLMRLSPVVPFHIQNYLYGLSQIPMRTCLIASWLGMLPAMAVSLMVGTTINAGGGEHWWLMALGLVATVTAATLITRCAKRHYAKVAAVASGRR